MATSKSYTSWTKPTSPEAGRQAFGEKQTAQQLAFEQARQVSPYYTPTGIEQQKYYNLLVEKYGEAEAQQIYSEKSYEAVATQKRIAEESKALPTEKPSAYKQIAKESEFVTTPSYKDIQKKYSTYNTKFGRPITPTTTGKWYHPPKTPIVGTISSLWGKATEPIYKVAPKITEEAYPFVESVLLFGSEAKKLIKEEKETYKKLLTTKEKLSEEGNILNRAVSTDRGILVNGKYLTPEEFNSRIGKYNAGVETFERVRKDYEERFPEGKVSAAPTRRLVAGMIAGAPEFVIGGLRPKERAKEHKIEEEEKIKLSGGPKYLKETVPPLAATLILSAGLGYAFKKGGKGVGEAIAKRTTLESFGLIKVKDIKAIKSEVGIPKPEDIFPSPKEYWDIRLGIKPKPPEPPLLPYDLLEKLKKQPVTTIEITQKLPKGTTAAEAEALIETVPVTTFKLPKFLAGKEIPYPKFLEGLFKGKLPKEEPIIPEDILPKKPKPTEEFPYKKWYTKEELEKLKIEREKVAKEELAEKPKEIPLPREYWAKRLGVKLKEEPSKQPVKKERFGKFKIPEKIRWVRKKYAKVIPAESLMIAKKVGKGKYETFGLSITEKDLGISLGKARKIKPVSPYEKFTEMYGKEFQILKKGLKEKFKERIKRTKERKEKLKTQKYVYTGELYKIGEELYYMPKYRSAGVAAETLGLTGRYLIYKKPKPAPPFPSIKKEPRKIAKKYWPYEEFLTEEQLAKRIFKEIPRPEPTGAGLKTIFEQFEKPKVKAPEKEVIYEAMTKNIAEEVAKQFQKPVTKPIKFRPNFPIFRTTKIVTPIQQIQQRQIYKGFTNPLINISKNIQKQKQKIAPRLLQKPIITQIGLTQLRQGEMEFVTPLQTQAQLQLPKLKHKRYLKFQTPEVTITPLTTRTGYGRFGFPILWPPSGGGWGARRGRLIKGGGKITYKPSLIAIAKGIRGKAPKFITGLEIRPIPRSFLKRKRMVKLW